MSKTLEQNWKLSSYNFKCLIDLDITIVKVGYCLSLKYAIHKVYAFENIWMIFVGLDPFDQSMFLIKFFLFFIT